LTKSESKDHINFGVPNEVQQGLNCIKSKVWGQLRVQLKELKARGLN